MGGEERGKPIPRETLSVVEQASNFVTLRDLIIKKSSTGSSSSGRLALLDAFRKASASPVNFPGMAFLTQDYGNDSFPITLSVPYTSSAVLEYDYKKASAPFSLPGPYMNASLSPYIEDSDPPNTEIAILPTTEKNPYSILHIARFTLAPNVGRIGYTIPRVPIGLFIAMPIKKGPVTYFVVERHPDDLGRLQIDANLDQELQLAMMHDIKTAVTAMLKE